MNKCQVRSLPNDAFEILDDIESLRLNDLFASFSRVLFLTAPYSESFVDGNRRCNLSLRKCKRKTK